MNSNTSEFGNEPVEAVDALPFDSMANSNQIIEDFEGILERLSAADLNQQDPSFVAGNRVAVDIDSETVLALHDAYMQATQPVSRYTLGDHNAFRLDGAQELVDDSVSHAKFAWSLLEEVMSTVGQKTTARLVSDGGSVDQIVRAARWSAPDNYFNGYYTVIGLDDEERAHSLSSVVYQANIDFADTDIERDPRSFRGNSADYLNAATVAYQAAGKLLNFRGTGAKGITLKAEDHRFAVDLLSNYVEAAKESEAIRQAIYDAKLGPEHTELYRGDSVRASSIWDRQPVFSSEEVIELFYEERHTQKNRDQNFDSPPIIERKPVNQPVLAVINVGNTSFGLLDIRTDAADEVKINDTQDDPLPKQNKLDLVQIVPDADAVAGSQMIRIGKVIASNYRSKPSLHYDSMNAVLAGERLSID